MTRCDRLVVLMVVVVVDIVVVVRGNFCQPGKRPHLLHLTPPFHIAQPIHLPPIPPLPPTRTELRLWRERDKEMRAVAVHARICHAQEPPFLVSWRRVGALTFARHNACVGGCVSA